METISIIKLVASVLLCLFAGGWLLFWLRSRRNHKYPHTTDLLPGERHFYGYNYCGPGTNVEARRQMGSQPVNALDACCYRHDQEEAFNPDIRTGYDHVRLADDRLTQCLEQVIPRSQEEAVDQQAMLDTMRTKRRAERVGLITGEEYTSGPDPAASIEQSLEQSAN